MSAAQNARRGPPVPRGGPPVPMSSAVAVRLRRADEQFRAAVVPMVPGSLRVLSWRVWSPPPEYPAEHRRAASDGDFYAVCPSFDETLWVALENADNLNVEHLAAAAAGAVDPRQKKAFAYILAAVKAATGTGCRACPEPAGPSLLSWRRCYLVSRKQFLLIAVL